MKFYLYILLTIFNLIFIFNELNAQTDFDPSEYGWKQNVAMDNRFVDRTYLDIQFLKEDPNYGWVCGFQGSVLRTTDGGETWIASEIFGPLLPGTGQLESIQFLNKDVGFLTVADNPIDEFLGDQRGATFKSVDGGATWSLALTSTPEDNVSLWGHHFLDENYGFVLGGSCGDIQYFFKTENGGQTWRKIEVNGNADGFTKLADPLLFPNGEGYAVSSGYLWETNDYGETWRNDIKTKVRLDYELAEPITLFNSNTGQLTYLTQNGDEILIEYTDINRVTITSDLKTIVVDWNYVGFINTSSGDTLYIKGFGSYLSLSESFSRVTESYEFNWHEEIARFGDSFFIPYSLNCDGNNNSPAGFLFTTDKGENWNDIPTTGPNYGTFLLDELRGWGCGFNETVIYTSDGGFTWENVNCGFEPGTNLDDIWFVDDTTGWVAGDGIFKLTKIQKVKPEINVQDTILLCNNSSVSLEVTEDFEYYRWNNGRETKSITISEPGEYYLYAYKNFICDLMFSDTVIVKEVEPKELTINTIGNDPLCEGDVLTLSANEGFLSYEWSTGENSSSIDVAETGIYEVVAIDSNGCEVSLEYEVLFLPTPDVSIIADNDFDICVGEILNLTGKPDNLNYLWTYQFSDDSQEQIVISQQQQITPDQSGYYKLYVTNEFGCANETELLFVEIRDDSNRLEFRFDPLEEALEIDDTNFPNLTCRNLIIDNISPDDQILDDAYFRKNFAFSISVAQLPIFIPGNGSAELQVCFSPTKIELHRDTLVIPDNCTDHLIPMVATGLGNNYNANSRCDIAIELNTVDVINKYSYKSGDPFPNPASSKLTLSFSRTQKNNFDDSKTKYYLYNSLNRKVAEGVENIVEISSDNQLLTEYGKVIFDLNGLPSGAYFIMITNHDFHDIKPVMISR